MLKMIKALLSLFVVLWVLGFGSFLFFIKNQDNSKVEIFRNAMVFTGGQQRIVMSLDLLKANKIDKLFISGVNDKIKKADLLGEEYFNLADNVVLGYKAEDTKGNVLEAKEWLEDNAIYSVTVITSDYHIYRSFIELKNEMPELEVSFYSVKNVDDEFLKSIYNWKMLFTEYNKLIYVFITNGVS